eukprot:SAG31_NODE_2697_length_5227_cov_1.318643_2_plen_187_part_00
MCLSAAYDNQRDHGISIEQNDKLNENEVTVQRLIITPGAGWTSKRLYFVIQFFDFGSAVTQTVELKPVGADDEFGTETPHALLKQAVETSAASPDASEGASLSVKFTVPGYGSGRTPLAPYLCMGTFHVEAWDADSLMPMGSLRATLEPLLRQGKDSVETTIDAELQLDRLPGPATVLCLISFAVS